MAVQVKTLRGGNGRRSHDEARPWGGLGFDVKSNTYASAPGPTGDVGIDGSGGGSGGEGGGGEEGNGEAVVVAGAGTGTGRASGGTPRRRGGAGVAEPNTGGRPRAEGSFIERLLGNRSSASPKY